MTAGRAQRRAWSEQRVARELEAWFAERGFDVWPTCRTFVRDGRKRLHAEVVRSGGAARWALELGVAHVVHPRRPGLSDEQIAAVLRALLREHRPQRFPTLTWLARHGPPGLAAAVRRTGGGTRWAQALAMPAPQPARWTNALIGRTAPRVCRRHALAKPRAVSGSGRHRRATRRLPRPRQPLVGRAARPLHPRPAQPTQRRDGR